MEVCQHVPPVVDEFDGDVSVFLCEAGWDNITAVAVVSLYPLGSASDVFW